MSASGLSAARLRRLRAVLSRHVEAGDMPGLVALVARRGEVHVEAIGTTEAGGSEPMRRDTIFRIASVTKQIAAATAMTLVEECRLRLDDPVDVLLPELADRQVLLKPLIADLVEHETYFEARQATNEPVEFSLAVKLDPARAALWETNLAIFLDSKYHAPHKPVSALVANGVQFKVQTNAFVSIVRSGEWAALSLEVTDQGVLLGLEGFFTVF